MLQMREILDILPHRYPFLLVDRILELETNTRAVGIKNVRVSAEVFSGVYSAQTTENGSFVIVMPEGARFGQRVDLKIDPTPSGLPVAS